MKPRIVKAIVSALGGVALGVSYYLHSVDHPVFVPVRSEWCSSPLVSCFAMGYSVPPPWYANLWPEALALGLALLFLPWAKEIPHAVKVAYRKWYEWEFSWEKELNNKP